MTIGLVYAMPGEIENADRRDPHPPIRTEAGVSFIESAPHIIACSFCGVSKVNAAMGAQPLISLYHPDLVLNAGVAGRSRMSPIGTIVLAGGLRAARWIPLPSATPWDWCPPSTRFSSPRRTCLPLKAAMDATGVPIPAGWPPATGSPPIPPLPLDRRHLPPSAVRDGARRGAGSAYETA